MPNQHNTLNNYPIYVINLKEDKTRRNYIKSLFKRYNINYFLIIVKRFTYETLDDRIKTKIKDNILGCTLSHLWCIRHAINARFKQFIIFEDDIIFHKNFETLFKSIVDKHISKVDLLMLGALDTNLTSNLHNYNNDGIYYPTKNILGAHANIYKLEFAQSLLDYKLNSTKIMEFDLDYLVFMEKWKIGICMPNLVVCELSTTNINHNFSPLNPTGYMRYKTYFPVSFSYNDYEYLLIIFIDFIKEELDKGVQFATFEEMVVKFSKKPRTHNVNEVCKYIISSGYKMEEIIDIIDYIKTDVY